MPAPVSVPLPEYLPLMNRADFEQNRARSRAWARARKIRTVLNLDDLALVLIWITIADPCFFQNARPVEAGECIINVIFRLIS